METIHHSQSKSVSPPKMKQKLFSLGEIIKHRLILESITDGLLALSKQWEFLYINKEAEQLIEVKRNEVIGKNIWERFPHLRKTRFYSEYHKSIKEKLPVNFEEYSTRVNKWFQVKAYPIKEGLIVYFHEITYQKRVEHNLQFLVDASKILSSALEYKKTLQGIAQLAVPNIADWCSIDMRREDGSVELITMQHKDPKKLKWGIRFRKNRLVDALTREALANVFKTRKSEFYPYLSQKMLAARVKNKRTLSLLGKVGLTAVMIVPLIIRKKPIGAITFVSTESKKHFTKVDLHMAEQLADRAALAIENVRLYQSLQNQKERLDTIITNIPGVVWEAWGEPDEENQRIDYVSPYIEKMIGYSTKTWLTTPNFWLSIVHPEDKKRAADESAKIFKSGKGGISRFRWVRKDKKIVWVEAQSTVIKDKNDHPVGMRGVTMDITERMNLEKRKDEFISMASHELKTPITSLKVYNQMLQRYANKEQNTQILSYLEKMENQINKLANLIQDLLDISKIQVGKLEYTNQEFELIPLIKDVVDSLEHTTHHTIKIFGKTKIKLLGDQDRIGQIIINLLTNAIKYSPDAEKINIFAEKSKEQVIVSVQDFGIGIEKEYLHKIFDRFFQISDPTERTFPGLGIGLYISQEIAKRHGGYLTVKSEKGKGSTFSLVLPIKKQAEGL